MDINLPEVGDKILLRRDALVEVASTYPGSPTTWRYLAAGSRGKLIGWRDRTQSYAVVDMEDVDRRLVVFVRETSVELARARESARAYRW
jgi:hypothetical protein